MFLRPITLLSSRVPKKWSWIQMSPAGHLGTCPTKRRGGGGGGALVRADRSAPCRLVFFPDEWFKFFHVKTGVSGLYILFVGLWNYWLSKEIYVMEHEYYTGLSIVIMVAVAVKKGGPPLAAYLDKEVDDITQQWYTGRKQEMAMNEEILKSAKLAQTQAQGQKLLMDAKKQNILMQLEAIYRERSMHVYNTVKGRMDYHMKKHEMESRIHQKWMVRWILQNVRKSITPEFEKAALSRAIKEIEDVANRA